MSEAVTIIPDNAFRGCGPLEVAEVSGAALYRLKTKKQNVTKTLTDVGEKAFKVCLIEDDDGQEQENNELQ